MKNAIRISVKKPCSEKFENCSQTSVGGFCDFCLTEVIEFTEMSSKELMVHFNNTLGKTCGRFKSSQLKIYGPMRSNKASTNLVSRGIAVLSFSLLSLCTVSNARAQGVASIDAVVQTELSFVQPPVVVGNNAIEKYTVTGTVLDEENSPLAGVNVILKGTTEGVVTDFDGKFEFPRTLEVDDILIFSYIGYEAKEYQVTGGESDVIEITIRFDNSDIFLMGEVTVEGVYESKPNIFQKFIALFK